MRTVSFDLETHRFRFGCMAPKMVCLTWAEEDEVGLLGGDAKGRSDALAFAKRLFQQAALGELHIVGQHIFYDLGVLCAEDPSFIELIFQCFDVGTLHCTKIVQMMIDNVNGDLKFIEDELGEKKVKNNFDLQSLAKRHLDVWLSKGDAKCTSPRQAECACHGWRMHYWELDGVAIDAWPEEAKKYPLRDADVTLKIYLQQWRLVAPEGIPREVETMRAAWALYLMSLWGIRTDEETVNALDEALGKDLERIKADLIPTGLLREDETRDMKLIKARVEACFAEMDLPVPRTDAGAVSTSRDTLRTCKDPALFDPGDKKEGRPPSGIAEWVSVGKVKSTYVPAIRRGTRVPINTTYNPILETYRTSASRPNVQNPPRKGGVRECFRARPGSVYVFVDYETAELRSLAQVCIDLVGYSAMAEALRADKDLHIDLAADLLGTTYEELFARYQAGDKEAEEARQFCKIGNFGLPGGMGALAFQDYARTGYGMIISFEQACAIHEGFPKKWTEIPPYFDICASLAGHDGVRNRVQFVRSGLIRGDVSYTAICNGFFQHLTAMGAKDACYAVARECYLGVMPNGKKSPLAGSRPVLFLHDEIGTEVPYLSMEHAHLAAERMALVMKQAMERWIEDVPVKCGPTMTRRWLKGAKGAYVDGMLVPSKAIKENDKTVWVPDLDDARMAA